MRVDLDISNQTLAWAAYRASEIGISRRKFLTNVIERFRIEQELIAIPSYLLKQPATPEESFKKE